LSILVDLGYEDLPWPEALCPIEEAPTPLIKYIEYLSDYKLIYEVSIFNEHSGKEIKATAIEYRKAIDQERIVPRRIIRVILEFM
jgi:glyceraldehyde-3-phosphate dehydrogenase/erythrose-4-phosphate dehydrogenase